MRIIKFLGEDISIQSNVLTPFFYQQQFKKDIYKDLGEFFKTESNTIGNRIVWALSKSIEFDIYDFDQWILAFDNGDTDWHEVHQELDRFLYSEPTEKKSKKKEESKPIKHYPIKQVSYALRSGFSFESLKYIQPFDLHSIYDDEEDAEVKQATQADIDNLLF